MNFEEKLEQKKWELTEEEFEKNADEIFAELSLCAEKSPNPTFVFVGGQAGSGKSALVAREYNDMQGNAIIIDQDELRTKFPKEKYEKIHEQYTEREEFLILKPYIQKMIYAIKDRAIAGGYNLIVESALRSIRIFIDFINDLNAHGYESKLSVLSVPEVEGNISMLTRYCYYLQKDGECRRNTRIDPVAVQKITENMQTLDDAGLFQDIAGSIRGEERDSLPVEVYSKRKEPQISPVEAYKKAQIEAFKQTKRNFPDRYEEIRVVLAEYGETEQLQKLETIKKSFEEKEKEME